MKNYYNILGVSNTATAKEIQKAYRELARKYHPDVNGGNAKYDKIFTDINEAYKTLKDDEKRKEYDKSQNGGTKTDTPPKGEQKKTYKPPESKDFDFSSVNNSFESFFGFNAKTGEVTNEDKLKKKNPIDTSDMFEKFMGFKK
ncbi:MAG: DnaJ domain-containing protein [Eubacteriales bacterium]